MDLASLLERACARARLTPALIRPTGEGLESRCPFCKSRKASFGLAARARGRGSGPVFSCQKCHETGGVPTLARLAGVDPSDVDITKIGRPRQHFDQVEASEWMPFVRTLGLFLVNPPPLEGSADRGLREEDVAAYRIGYDHALDELVIPTFDQEGTCVGVTRREAQPGARYTHTKFPRSKHLYGAHLVDPAKSRAISVSEGQLDAPALPPFLPEDVPSVATLGASMSKAQAALLASWARPVWLAYDNDDAGLLGTVRASKLLREAGVTSLWVLLYPGSDPGGLPQAQARVDAGLDPPFQIRPVPYMKWLLKSRARIQAAERRLKEK